MHGSRSAYYIIGEGVLSEPDFLCGGVRAGAPPADAQPSVSPFKFGRLFPPRRGMELTATQRDVMVNALVQLGLRMNNPEAFSGQPPPDPGTLNSKIPAGYTYLGQFIAHEITFDNTDDLLPVEPDPANLRSPSLDLDSLYGDGPGGEESKRMYQDGDPAKLKLDRTGKLFDNPNHPGFDSDLPRDKERGFRALTGDPRNDENLPVAQTTVAFIKFHNLVVDDLRAQKHTDADIFDCARVQVIRHFQWIILKDYLPTLVDQDLIDGAVARDWDRFKVKRSEDLYMPLEFSAAAFRIGHTMVRGAYRWNEHHASKNMSAVNRSATLMDLFVRTAFRGAFGAQRRGLEGDWVIDWRRFYRFPNHPADEHLPNHFLPDSDINMAGRIDTRFTMPISDMPSFNGNLPPERRSITVRNLLRGFALGLPTGEEVAELLQEEPLTEEELMGNEVHAAVLGGPLFWKKTPLWYYILKEAEVRRGGNRLGRVGGRIVAETLVGLIKNSRHSILKSPGWFPRYTRRGVRGTESAQFGMTDLLECLLPTDVNPYQ